MVEADGSHVLKPVLLGLTMVVTGSVNTIAAKWADSMKVDNKHFNHPFVQAICMFIGELSCLFVYFIARYIQNHRDQTSSYDDQGSGSGIPTHMAEQHSLKFNPWIFAVPAFCDVLATSIMYIGLNLTQASSFQMLRGSVIIFTGFFSVAFLKSYLQGFRWLGMGFITIGLVIVGVSDIILDENSKHDINGIITGDLLIIIAQIIVAVQMVVEQKIVSEFNAPPLLVVGLEGLFGLTILTFLLFPMYYIKVPSIFSTNPYHRLEDVFYAFREIKSNPWIGCALLLTMVSVAFFNFAGISVTKELSATTRMVLDSVRILLIWLVSIPFFGEHFIPLQLLGFALLIFGMFVYNDIFFGPYLRQKILPLIRNNKLAGCCISFWGVDLVTADCNILIEDNND
uniref:TPT domain-containing protein n=1 Tax=Elaeophora elaphi TaxID=1147741 RepID=A0A0R3RX94_9BILA